MALNARQEKFVLEYAKCGNATEAYVKAGYKQKTQAAAGRNATRLMKMPEIRERLEQLREEMRSEAIASVAEIQERLSRILRMEETEDVVVTEGVDKGITESKIVQKRPQLKDVIRAGESLAKMQGAFDTNLSVTMIVPQIVGEESLEE